MKGVGQRFAQGVVEFRDALSKYSIHSGFNFDFVKNDKDRVTVHCKRRANLGCLWSVHARVKNYSKAFVIKQFDDVHTCGSSFRTIKHARMTSSMIGVLISSDIRNKALTSTNLKTYLSVKSRESKEYLLILFSRCAYAPTIELFNELFEEFKGRCGRSVEKFLENLPNECWRNAYFQGKRYGEMCTNTAESFNSWIRNERHLFSTSLVDAIRVKIMEQFSRRREVGNKWNRIVCPFAEKKLEEAFNDTKAWIVKKCSDDIYEIQLDHSVMVDIGKRCCSCRLWEIDSFPCKHGFCAIKRSGKDLNCFLDDYYRKLALDV
ncbi:hypothetical protein ACSBR1_042347 [Camellia fascicularis]